MWKLASNMQNIAPFVSERFANLARNPQVANTYFARIIRAVQLSAHEYFQQVAMNAPEGIGSAELPLFAPMLQDLTRGTFHLSTNWVAIPGEYLEPDPQPVHRFDGGHSGLDCQRSGLRADLLNFRFD